jgi:hypothetical protein
VRVPRHRNTPLRRHQSVECVSDGIGVVGERRQGILQPKSHRDEHLVVARSPEMDATPGFAACGDKAILDRGMAILVRQGDRPRSAREILGDDVERAAKGVGIGGREIALLLEHARMGLRGRQS